MNLNERKLPAEVLKVFSNNHGTKGDILIKGYQIAFNRSFSFANKCDSQTTERWTLEMC